MGAIWYLHYDLFDPNTRFPSFSSRKAKFSFPPSFSPSSLCHIRVGENMLRAAAFNGGRGGGYGLTSRGGGGEAEGKNTCHKFANVFIRFF